jgi:hypothetical protein
MLRLAWCWQLTVSRKHLHCFAASASKNRCSRPESLRKGEGLGLGRSTQNPSWLHPPSRTRRTEPRAQELADPKTGDSKWLEDSEKAAKDSGKSYSTLRFRAAASYFVFTALVKLELSPVCQSPELGMQKVL